MSNCEYTNEKNYDSDSEYYQTQEWDEMKQIVLHPIKTYNSMNTFEKIGCFFPHAFLCGIVIYNCIYGF